MMLICQRASRNVMTTQQNVVLGEDHPQPGCGPDLGLRVQAIATAPAVMPWRAARRLAFDPLAGHRAAEQPRGHR
jgi:hypothetical protein